LTEPDPQQPDLDAAGQAPAQGDPSIQDALAQTQDALEQMQQTVEDAAPGDAIADAVGGMGFDSQPMPLPGFEDDPEATRRMDLLGDVDLDVSIELGRTEMFVEDVLKLGSGSVVELDKLAGDPVDVYVNGRMVARGEVLVLNDNFCIRISEIVANLEEQAEEAMRQQEQAEV